MLLWDVCPIDFALFPLLAMLDSNCIYIHVAVDQEYWIRMEVVVAFVETEQKIVLVLSGWGIVVAEEAVLLVSYVVKIANIVVCVLHESNYCQV